MTAKHSFIFLQVWTNSSIKIPNDYQPVIRRYTPECLMQSLWNSSFVSSVLVMVRAYTLMKAAYTFHCGGSLIVIILSLIGTGSSSSITAISFLTAMPDLNFFILSSITSVIIYCSWRQENANQTVNQAD